MIVDFNCQENLNQVKTLKINFQVSQIFSIFMTYNSHDMTQAMTGDSPLNSRNVSTPSNSFHSM